MAKAERPKAKPKPKASKNEQYERFKETARELGVDNEESTKDFEHTFKKIVPPKRAISGFSSQVS